MQKIKIITTYSTSFASEINFPMSIGFFLITLDNLFLKLVKIKIFVKNLNLLRKKYSKKILN